MDDLYRDIILEHWQNPSHSGIIEDADLDAEKDNPLCGDHVRVTGVIQDGVLKKVAFQTTGCAISVASASLLASHVEGMALKQIKNMQPNEVLEQLGLVLTPARTNCALLSLHALRTRL